MKKFYLLFPILVSLSTTQAQTIRYVKQGATGSGNSWADASGNIQNMINLSNAGDKVYVAEGIYIPSEKASNNVFQWLTDNPRGTTNDKAKAIVLKADVEVYGGFSSTNPTADLSLRDFIANETIITTDVNQNDAGFNDLTTYSENYYHAVIAAGITTDTRLDGFTINGGTDYTSDDHDYILVNSAKVQQGNGGGITVVDAKATFENIKIHKTGKPIYVKSSNTNFKNLSVTNSFYLFYIQGSTISIDNMNFSDNVATLRFESEYNFPNETFAYLKNITFARNTGGAIGIWRDAQKGITIEIDRAKFIGNITSSYGIIQNNGGNIKMSNTVATGNRSNNQSGFMVINALGPSIITKVDFINCTIVSNYNNFDWSNNTGAISGGAGTNTHVKIVNSIIWGNKMGTNYRNIFGLNNPNYTVKNSIIQDSFDSNGVWNPNYGVDSGGNSGVMPNFMQYVPIVTTAFSNGDFSLAAGSPGINAGDNTTYNTLLGTNYNKDVAGNDRIMGNTIDIGAYEFLEVLSLNEVANKLNTKVYPNPTSDYIYIEGLKTPTTYEVYNSMGQKATQGSLDSSKNRIQLTYLSQGIYYIKINTEQGSIVHKVIKK